MSNRFKKIRKIEAISNSSRVIMTNCNIFSVQNRKPTLFSNFYSRSSQQSLNALFGDAVDSVEFDWQFALRYITDSARHSLPHLHSRMFPSSWQT